MEIVWLAMARTDLVKIRAYISEHNPKAASEVSRRILESTEHLMKSPYMGRTGKNCESRELIIPGTPYIVSYRVKNGRIEILRVFHGSQML
ncbi:MAG: type II toxin-antitoxin system RelE/ParE family toxin [Magnetococcales bacterium]|nr:type II toxin-antitoxin system RelE/ParE family toxin [Magnetococcales bacterium]